jgi:hypothetical protein
MYLFCKGQDDTSITMTGSNYATSNELLTVFTPIFQQHTHLDSGCNNSRILHHITSRIHLGFDGTLTRGEAFGSPLGGVIPARE